MKLELKKSLFVVAAASQALLLSSCFNSDYDLSNIDTTARVKADNLVVPLNLDAITLDKVLDLSDDGQIKEVVDPVTGEKIYAAVETGTFLSSEIKVPDFTANKPTITKIQSDIDMEELVPLPYQSLNDYINALKAAGAYDESKQKEYEMTVWNQILNTLREMGEPLCRYTFDQKQTHFSTQSSSVDKAIRSVDNIKVDATFTVDFEVLQLNNLVTVPLSNLKLRIPKGLTLTPSHGTYDSSTGILDLTADSPTIKNGVATFQNGESGLVMTITAINAKEAGAELTTKEDADGTMTISGDVQVVSGKIEVGCDDFASDKTFYDLPRTGLHYECIPELSDVDVNYFTGRIKYGIKDVNIDPITLQNLPEILSNEKTDVILGNPQVYVKANDPVAKYNVKAVSGFQFCGERNGVKRTMYSLDNGTISISKAMNTYCMSPTQPSKYYSGYTDAEYVKFTGLKNILSGEGLPDKINVYVVDPCIPEQQVTDFRLGEQLDKVAGEYTFFAPLSLEDGSVIVYEKTDKDWDEETLDHLVIETLKVTATVTSQIPLGATLTLSPLGKDGKEISGVSFTCSTLEPNAQEQAIEFVQTGGVIKNLDGITLRATIVSGGAEKTLQSVQTLDVKNVKVTVSGYYEDEL